MDVKNLVIGALIGLLIGLAGGYLFFNGSSQENTILLGSQIADLTQQVSDLEQQLSAEEEDTINNLEAVIQQKNNLISNLLAEIEALQPEEETESDGELGTWEAIPWQGGYLVHTGNITVTKNPITFTWPRDPGDYGTINICVYDAETNYLYAEDLRSDFDTDFHTEVIPPGKCYVICQSSLSFTLNIEEPT